MDMIPASVQSRPPVKKGLGKDGSSGQSVVEKERETMFAKSTLFAGRGFMSAENRSFRKGQSSSHYWPEPRGRFSPFYSGKRRDLPQDSNYLISYSGTKIKRNRLGRLSVLRKIQSTLRLHGM